MSFIKLSVTSVCVCNSLGPREVWNLNVSFSVLSCVCTCRYHHQYSANLKFSKIRVLKTSVWLIDVPMLSALRPRGKLYYGRLNGSLVESDKWNDALHILHSIRSTCGYLYMKIFWELHRHNNEILLSNVRKLFLPCRPLYLPSMVVEPGPQGQATDRLLISKYSLRMCWEFHTIEKKHRLVYSDGNQSQLFFN